MPPQYTSTQVVIRTARVLPPAKNIPIEAIATVVGPSSQVAQLSPSREATSVHMLITDEGRVHIFSFKSSSIALYGNTIVD